MPISASYTAAQFRLAVIGTAAADGITLARDAGGTLLVNAGSVTVTGGPATVANTSLIEVFGDAGADNIALDETNGALPNADLYGGAGNDTLTGGSGSDNLFGEADNDTLFGRGGTDLLYGGGGNDTLSGGDGDDQMFGEDGDDRMIWNPGDDSDLMEGGIGSDTAEVNGGNGAETFTIAANGTRVRLDRVTPAPFSLDIGTTESLVLNANGGDDIISTSGSLAGLISLTIDGGAGNDTILGGNGADVLIGGDGNDLIDGNQGNDTALLGNGDDTFQWDPGDGSDIVEGQGGSDTLVFNSSNANEIVELSANGARTLLARNVGAIVMDVNDVESFTINALGGIDAFTVNDLAGTDVSAIALDLAGTIGGASGDAAADTLTVNGSNGANTIGVTGSGTAFAVSGLTASIAVTNSEGANDSLVLNALGGDDSITATTLAAGVVRLTIDGGAGNDTIMASQGADTILGGDGNDFVFGDNGSDVAFLGIGNDVFEWAPGDGNDVVEGQADFDELRFDGANVTENINIAANGGRILFTRDVAAVTMDLDDVEKIRFDAFGGADNITVGDLTGTDATAIELRLAASGGGGDGAIDTITFNATTVADSLSAASSGGTVTVTGLPWSLSLLDAEGANDRLVLNGQGGDDVINASALAAGLVSLTINGGLGADLIVGSAGGDQVNGGDGNDTALMGAGDDVFTWNPGDDNDIIEGQAGSDTLHFNGANVAENITISANGGRALFFRDIASVTMDLNDTEVIQFIALGGADNITVNDLSATDVTQLAFDLASTPGGAVGDALVDTLTLNASEAANAITVSGNTGALLTVTGLPAGVTISQFETSGVVDQLTIHGLGGNDDISALSLIPHLGTLTIDGGAGNDTIRSNGDGTYLGGSNDDAIFAGLTNSSEILDGGSGIDTLVTTSWGGLYNINMVTGVTNYSGESFINFENLITGAGADTITGTAGANLIITQDGIDNVNAGAGNDTVSGGTGGDTLDGGADFDFLDYRLSNAAVTINLATGSASGGDAAGDVFSNFEGVYGSALGDSLTGNASGNTLNGGDGDDFLSPGAGADSAVGGTGNDGVFFGASLDAADYVDGGAGTNDQVALQGNYAGLTLGANNLLNVESLVLLPGNDTRFGDLAGNFYSYALTTLDANVAAGQLLTVTFNTLRAGENAYFNGVAESNGSFLMYGGNGADNLTGGQQADAFFFGIGRFGVSDGVNAQGGADQLGLQGLYSGASAVTFSAAQLTSVETLVLLSGGDARFGSGGLPYSYDITMNDGNVAAGQSMTVNANTLLGTETLTFNGSAETNGKFSVFSGAGADTIVGSAGADTIYGGGGADVMTGGAGNDVFAYLSAAHSAAGAPDTITDFAAGDKLGLSAIDADTGTGGDQAFHLGATAGHTGDIVLAFDAGNNRTSVSLYVDGDAVADGVIWLSGNHTDLTGADFVL